MLADVEPFDRISWRLDPRNGVPLPCTWRRMMLLMLPVELVPPCNSIASAHIALGTSERCVRMQNPKN